MKFERRTVLITGGTSGIGLELAKQLHQRGNVVLVTGRDPERLEAARRTVPGLHTFQSDVSDPGAISALRASVLAQFPALDTLINNAGIMRDLNLHQERDLHDVSARPCACVAACPLRRRVVDARGRCQASKTPSSAREPLERGRLREREAGSAPS